MKPTTYIDWGGLKDIPFFYCDTKEDEGNKDFDIYYQGKLVLHDYNHCGIWGTAFGALSMGAGAAASLVFLLMAEALC